MASQQKEAGNNKLAEAFFSETHLQPTLSIYEERVLKNVRPEPKPIEKQK